MHSPWNPGPAAPAQAAHPKHTPRPRASRPAQLGTLAAGLLLAGFGGQLSAASLHTGSEVFWYHPADDYEYHFVCEEWGSSSAACGGIYSFEGSDLHYQANAQADFGVLKAYGSTSISQVGSPSGASTGPEGFDAWAESAFRDQWTISGQPAGTTGTLHLSFDLTGSWDFSDPDIFQSSNAGISHSFGMWVYGQGWVDGGLSFSGSSGTLSETITLSTSFIFGDELDFRVSLGAGSFLFDLEDGGFDGQGSYLDLSNTAIMTAIVVTDTEGNTSSFSLSTSSEAMLFEELAPSPIPVPAALPLFLGGLAGLMLWRRKTS